MTSTTKHPAHRWFFLAAALHAALFVPLSVAAMHGHGPLALAIPSGHAMEMLFGFALALVAGYLLGPQSARMLTALLVLWLVGRVAHVLLPHSQAAILLTAVFALLLASQLLPRLAAAKKWRNRAMLPLLAALCLGPLALTVAEWTGVFSVRQWVVRESVLLFALLMLFMGGRMIAPAVAGEFQRQGRTLEARVQPRIEAGLIIAMAVAFLLSAAPVTQPLAGLVLLGAGALTTIRLLRWRLWHCRARYDLLVLAAGYVWLALGLFMLGLGKIAAVPPSVAIHIVTVGALGTLASATMARTTLHRAGRNPARSGRLVIIAVLIAIAAAARSVAGFSIGPSGMLGLAATAWSVAFLILADLLWRTPARRPARRR